MPPVVIDANIAVALLVKFPWSDAAERMFLAWRREKASLFAPALWPAEVTSALRKVVAARQMSAEDALLAISLLPELGVRVYLPDTELLQASLRWVERLGQMVAYDAQYLSLAEHLEAFFWTADRKLYQRCTEIGADFVRLLS